MQNKLYLKFLKFKTVKILAGLFFVLLMGAYMRIFAIGLPYNPGDTLDPSCSPGSLDCTVKISSSLWSESSSNIYYNSGNVGIGTNNPQNLLNLYSENDYGITLGNANINAYTTAIRFDFGSNQAAEIEVDDTLNQFEIASLPGWTLQFRSNGSIAGNVDLNNDWDFIDGNITTLGSITSDSLTVGTDDLFISNNSIGIGTTTPQSKLDINGGVTIGSSYAGIVVAPTDGLLVNGHIQAGEWADFLRDKLGTAPFLFTSSTSDDTSSSMVVSNDYGQQYGAGLELYNYASYEYMNNNGNLGFLKFSANHLDINNNTSIVEGARIESNSESDWRDTGLGEFDSANLVFYTNSQSTLSEKMRLTSDGELGIGINNPLFKLDVSGSTRIQGGLVGIGASPLNNNLLFLNNYFDSTANQTGIRNLIYFSPTTNTGNSGYGMISSARKSGNFNLGLIEGIYSMASNHGNGTISSANAVSSHITLYGTTGSGSITDANGIIAEVPIRDAGNTGTIGTLAGVRIKNQGNTYVTNAYGLYIENQTGAVTNNYNLYSVGGINYFSGTVGIGTTSSSYKLQVGNNTVSGIVARFENSTGTCDINPTTTSLACSSDINLKKNITKLDNTEFLLSNLIDLKDQSILERINYITPVNYNWQTEEDGSEKHIGFIAQEVEQVFDGVVFTDSETNNKSIAYTNMIPYTVKAIQELDLKIKELSSLDTSNFNSFGYLIKEFIENSVNKFNKIFVKTIVTDGIEMTDSVTGESYCVLISNGEFNKIKGKCGEPAIEEFSSSVSSSETEDNTSDLVTEETEVVEEITEENNILIIEELSNVGNVEETQ